MDMQSRPPSTSPKPAPNPFLTPNWPNRGEQAGGGASGVRKQTPVIFA